jgi:hypothetical protein
MIFLFAAFIVLGPDSSPFSLSHGSQYLSHFTSYSDLEGGGRNLSETSAAIFCPKMKHQQLHYGYLLFKFCCLLNICHLRKAIHWGNDPINRWVRLLAYLVRTAAMQLSSPPSYFDVFLPPKKLRGRN